ncbi:helix-turn-helix domain-containing protein [Candidatus Enterococcus ferrettii]|uniref:HTH araC/xylS-type domain-containing protein n=1 Tax=Candidatus Enterococcus ferrettii TaxID=2815324 RepID=A0ABV0ESA0_9ENTE|nr:AraC family transcriptional regulator [Enterococcus sp. 665A]MBO1343106.1 helix-turn-helix transcriptional regulator [Enterococcus sp. 665A]
MIEKADLAASLLKKDGSVAIFENDRCIAEYGIADKELLESYVNNIRLSSENNKIIIKSFMNFTVFLSQYQDMNNIYLFLFLCERDDYQCWNEERKKDLLGKLKSALIILKENRDYPIKIEKRDRYQYTDIRRNESNFYSELENELSYFDNYQLEVLLLNLLDCGDISSVMRLFKKLSSATATIISTNKLQEQKFRIVSFLTLVTRMVIEKGYPQSHAYELSDKFIGQLDEISERDQLLPFVKTAVLEFFTLAKEKRFSYDSAIVNQTIEYIYDNIEGPISNDCIARHVCVHPVYLSSLFKKKTGITLSKFIKEAKVQEAKFLLVNTDLSYSEISNKLSFSSQSHFCRVFKELTSFTPKEYRVFKSRKQGMP